MIENLVVAIVVMTAVIWLVRRVYRTIIAATRAGDGEPRSCGSCGGCPQSEKLPPVVSIDSPPRKPR